MAYKLAYNEAPKAKCILFTVMPKCTCLTVTSIEPVAQIIHINMLLYNGQGD